MTVNAPAPTPASPRTEGPDTPESLEALAERHRAIAATIVNDTTFGPTADALSRYAALLEELADAALENAEEYPDAE